VEKTDERGGVAEGCQCTTSACGRREGATYRIFDNCTLLGHDAECHDPNMAMTASEIGGKLGLIYFNNNIEPRAKITSIINDFFLIFCTRERGSAQQPCIAACVNVFWWPFWPTCANSNVLDNRAGCALSTDVWQLAWVGRKCHQNQLIMVGLWCHMVKAAAACFVVVAWLSYDTQVVQYNAPTTPQPCETSPQIIAMIKWYPVLGKHSGIISSLWRLFCRGEQLAKDENRGSILGGISRVLGTLVHTTLLDN
jgi:hypothetical protein